MIPIHLISVYVVKAYAPTYFGLNKATRFRRGDKLGYKFVLFINHVCLLMLHSLSSSCDHFQGHNTTIIWFLHAVLATDEKYNEAIYSTAKRLVAAIDGLPDPGGPSVKDDKRESNFKTKEETEEKRGQFSLVVGGLLVIAFVVPMVQYYAYVAKK